MAELRTAQQVKDGLRRVFAAHAGMADPTNIIDDSNLYTPEPPVGDLGFPAPPDPLMSCLLVLGAGRVLGLKVAARFADGIVPPELGDLTTFGMLSIEMHSRLNRFGRGAVHEAICLVLEEDSTTVLPSFPIVHPNEAGARAFARNLEEEIRNSICNDETFEFTTGQEGDVMEDTTVGELTDLVIEVLAEAVCL